MKRLNAHTARLDGLMIDCCITLEYKGWEESIRSTVSVDDYSIHIDTNCLTYAWMITIKHILCFFALHLSFLFISYGICRCVNVHVDVDTAKLAYFCLSGHVRTGRILVCALPLSVLTLYFLLQQIRQWAQSHFLAFQGLCLHFVNVFRLAQSQPKKVT